MHSHSLEIGVHTPCSTQCVACWLSDSVILVMDPCLYTVCRREGEGGGWGEWVRERERDGDNSDGDCMHVLTMMLLSKSGGIDDMHVDFSLEVIV